MTYEVPDKVVRDLCKNLSGSTSITKDGKYEWELCHNQVEGFYLVRWDKQGFGVDYEIPDSLQRLLR